MLAADGARANWFPAAGAPACSTSLRLAAEPCVRQITGDWQRAGELWDAIGCPYEAALALAEADNQEALRYAYDDLQGMGAAPAAAIVARRLRLGRAAQGVAEGDPADPAQSAVSCASSTSARARGPARRPSGWDSPLKIGKPAPQIGADLPMRDEPARSYRRMHRTTA
jgi:hypothetical protein